MITRHSTRYILAALAILCLWKFAVEYPVQYQKFTTRPIIPAEPCSRIAKATVAVNGLNSGLIEDALRTHKVQNDIHGYTHHIATSEVVGDLSEASPKKGPRGKWSKPAYLLSLIVAELNKPESERLEWIFWFDADTVIMNPHTPLEIFVPPTSMTELSNVHLLIAANWDGLNSGAFAFRVDPWSVSLLSAVLAYPIYHPERLKTDQFRDQSAFQWLLQGKESPLAATPNGGKDNWTEVPMRWFNSLPINNAFSKKGDWIYNHNLTDVLFDNGTDTVFDDGKGKKVQPWKIKQGDMAVHFAGTGSLQGVRDSWMGGWLRRAELYLPEWANATKQEELKVEVEDFWKSTVNRRKVQQQMRAKNTLPKPNPNMAKTFPQQPNPAKQVPEKPEPKQILPKAEEKPLLPKLPDPKSDLKKDPISTKTSTSTTAPPPSQVPKLTANLQKETTTTGTTSTTIIPLQPPQGIPAPNPAPDPKKENTTTTTSTTPSQPTLVPQPVSNSSKPRA